MALIVAAIVALTTESSPRARRQVPPAPLPALPVSYANAAMGARGRLASGWTAVRGPGLLRLADSSGHAVIVIAAVPTRPLPRLLQAALGSVRHTYGRLAIRRGNGARLGGLPSQSVVVYARNRRRVTIRVLLAVAAGSRRSYVVEAFTARSAKLGELVEAQEAITALQLSG